jgi:hypothetical protein
MLVAGPVGRAVLGRRRGTAATAGTTWNPADKAADITLSNGNRTAANSTSNDKAVRSTTSKTTGVWYAEVTRLRPTSNSSDIIGVAKATASLATHLGSSASAGVTWDGRLLYGPTDIVGFGDDGTVGIGAFNTGAAPYTVGILLNLTNRLIRFYDSDGSVSSDFNLDHPSGANGLATGEVFLAVSASFVSGNAEDDNGLILNTGQSAWVIGLPPGAAAWG